MEEEALAGEPTTSRRKLPSESPSEDDCLEYNVWVTASKDVIPVSALGTDHLINIWQRMQRDNICPKLRPMIWDEMVRRKLVKEPTLQQLALRARLQKRKKSPSVSSPQKVKVQKGEVWEYTVPATEPAAESAAEPEGRFSAIDLGDEE